MTDCGHGKYFRDIRLSEVHKQFCQWKDYG